MTSRARIENASSPLLSLPAELRLQILGYVLDNLPLTDENERYGNSLDWLPPPILQTCHLFRREGLVEFLLVPVYFHIVRYDPYKTVVAFHDWVNAVTSYYRISMRPHVEIDVSDPHDTEAAVAAANFWKWMEDFYVNDQVAIFAREDFGDVAIRSRHIELRVTSRDRLYIYVKEGRLAKIFFAAYRLRQNHLSWDAARAVLVPVVEAALLFRLYPESDED